MLLADNGGDGALSGLADPRWDDADLAQLRNIPLALFDAVETGATLCTDATPTCRGAPLARSLEPGKLQVVVRTRVK